MKTVIKTLTFMLALGSMLPAFGMGRVFNRFVTSAKQFTPATLRTSLRGTLGQSLFGHSLWQNRMTQQRTFASAFKPNVQPKTVHSIWGKAAKLGFWGATTAAVVTPQEQAATVTQEALKDKRFKKALKADDTEWNRMMMEVDRFVLQRCDAMADNGPESCAQVRNIVANNLQDERVKVRDTNAASAKARHEAEMAAQQDLRLKAAQRLQQQKEQLTRELYADVVDKSVGKDKNGNETNISTIDQPTLENFIVRLGNAKCEQRQLTTEDCSQAVEPVFNAITLYRKALQRIDRENLAQDLAKNGSIFSEPGRYEPAIIKMPKSKD